MRGCAVLCLLEGGWSGVPDAPGPLCRWRWEGRRRGRRLGWRFHRGDHCHRRLCCWSVWGHQLKDEKKKNRLKERNKEVAKKICKWREIGTEQAIQIDERVGGGESDKTRGTKGEQEKRVRCQLLWHTNTVVFSDGRLKGILKHYPTLNPSLFIIQQKCPHTHTHTEVTHIDN